MKKLILITSILFIFLVLFFEVSRVVIVIKFGHGHEITIGRMGSIESIPGKLIKARNRESVIKGELFTLLNGKASEKHIGIRTAQVVNYPKGSGFIVPWLFVPRFVTGYPAMNIRKPYKSDDFYTKQVVPEFDFHQDSESNYAHQQQILFDIQAITSQSVKSNFVRTEWIAELLPTDQASNLNSVNEQSGNGNLALQQQHGFMNVALIHQVGYNNIAIQTQNGDINISSAIQVGSLNLSVQNQNSRFNDAEVIQSGMLNNAKQSQNQELPGGFNKALAYQGGAYNSSIQKQNGTLNQANSIQSGLGNMSEQNQSGNLNDALIAQNSFGSVAHQSQNSGLSASNTGNKAEIYQSGGSGNYAEQTQELINGGFINSAVIRQNGSSNFAKQLQTGQNAYSTISQKGSNNYSSVSQIAF